MTRESGAVDERRRWVGVFIRTTNYRYGEVPWQSLCVERTLSGARSVRQSFAVGDRTPGCFHEALLPRLRLLDSALYLDETFVSRSRGRFLASGHLLVRAMATR